MPSPTDTTEKGLETLIMRHMTGEDGIFPDGGSAIQESPDVIAASKAGGSGWHAGSSAAYDRAHCIDVTQLFAFLKATQPDTLAKLNIGNYGDSKNITRQKFLARISSEVGKRGVIDVLRRGISDGPLHFEMFYGTPSPGNAQAAERFSQNRFSITRQLRYSQDETQRSLDLAAFINGLTTHSMPILRIARVPIRPSTPFPGSSISRARKSPRPRSMVSPATTSRTR